MKKTLLYIVALISFYPICAISRPLSNAGKTYPSIKAEMSQLRGLFIIVALILVIQLARKKEMARKMCIVALSYSASAYVFYLFLCLSNGSIRNFQSISFVTYPVISLTSILSVLYLTNHKTIKYFKNIKSEPKDALNLDSAVAKPE